MPKDFPLQSVAVVPISTPFRKIFGLIPHPETIRQLESLQQHESRGMGGQPPVVWDRAQGVNVYDGQGNMWLDLSSGVLVTNAGHGHAKIAQAIIDQASKPMLFSFAFVNEARVRLVEKLAALAPPGLDRVLLRTTGAEAIESALKFMRTTGRHIADDKNVIVSFNNDFYGRTLGAQQVGGTPEAKSWIKNLDPEIIQVPFPDGFHCRDTGFDVFKNGLAKLGIGPERVAGVISETFQGGGPNFMPKAYAQALRRWCHIAGALLCFDEVQAGFGRTGRQWGFELYDVVPDLFCIGKGFSSSMPISAVIGPAALLDQYAGYEMTSTHAGHPVCCAAALANIEAIEEEDLVANAADVGTILQNELQAIQARFPDVVGTALGMGLVGGLQMVKKGTQEPDSDLAWNIVHICFRRGLLMFAPVGYGLACIKISPPLCISAEAVKEATQVISEAIEEAIN